MSRARDIANYGDGIDTSSITSGTFADARIAQSNVTQHEGSIDALGSVASGTFNGTIGSSAIQPSNMSYYVSDFTDAFDDSTTITVTTAGYGFGTVVGPISVANYSRIRMHIIGGMVDYSGGDSFGSCVNYHTSTFSSSTTGTFDTLNFNNSPSNKQTSVYCLAEYSNTSGSAVNIYFRQGFTSAFSQSARWFSSSSTGNGRFRKWYELIRI